MVRFYNRPAIHIILGMLAAHGIKEVMVAKGGILSTPAMSAVIRRHHAMGGFILSASHNPGGPNEDFGIKYNIRNGGPAPEHLTESMYQHTRNLHHYQTLIDFAFNINQEGTTMVGATQVTVFNPLVDYTDLMQQVFDFNVLAELFKGGFRLGFDAMHGVTGPYAQYIFETCLGASPGTVIRGTPLEDFGGEHPDPNLAHAQDLLALMVTSHAPDLGAASDGDGDRNLILGKEDFVSPGDSLAIITEHAQKMIPAYQQGLAGVARSMPTSMAIDRVAESFQIPHFETPTGWKFFGNLMDANMCTLCGEESFGTGSNHIREKDGIWAVLCWLTILAKTGHSASTLQLTHWQRYGRSYFQRHDYERLDTTPAQHMIQTIRDQLPKLPGQSFGNSQITQADDFCYVDPVDGSKSSHQGIRIILEDGSRAICRLSGTGTEGATLRVYLERYHKQQIQESRDLMLAPLNHSLTEFLDLQKKFGRDQPDVIT